MIKDTCTYILLWSKDKCRNTSEPTKDKSI